MSEGWNSASASALRSSIASNPSSLDTMGIAILKVPTPPSTYSGGFANISFSLASKKAETRFYYTPPPSTPATVVSVSPSAASELGGSTLRIQLQGFQILASEDDVTCFFIGAQNVSVTILDLQYISSSAYVVIQLPSLSPGQLSAIIHPKSNSRNFASFHVNILSSIPFVIDAFSVAPSVVYQDYSEYISVRATGVNPTATLPNFALVLGSSVISSAQMKLTAAASRTDSSLFQFYVHSLASTAISRPIDIACSLTYIGVTQVFSLTVFPSIPQASISVSPSTGTSFGGSSITVVASFLREFYRP